MDTALTELPPLAARIAALLAGVGLVITVGYSVVWTLIVPRGREQGVAHVVEALVRRVLHMVARLRDGYEAKDHVLVLQGPATLLLLLAVWITLGLLGWGLVMWGSVGGALADALREAGSSMFTLGFHSRESGVATVIDFLAAATGLLTVALLISYLPVLYNAFTRREQFVTMLESRAGVPAWGPEILARHHAVGMLDTLGRFYAEWEEWMADVAESHTTYPMLVAFRSPRPLRSWITAILAVLDSAALQHALNGDEHTPSQARLCLRMGFTSLRDIAGVRGIPFDPDPLPDDPIALTYDEFLAGVRRLEQVGFPMHRTPEEAWPHFRGWRVNYESVAYALADRVTAPPAPWSGPRAELQGVVIAPVAPVDRQPGGTARRLPAPDPD